MKKLILLNICLLVSTLTLATPSKQQDDINIVVRPAIYGLWGMKIPEHQCVEYYNFKNNGKTVIHSAKEWSTGVYEYQPSNENKKIGALALQIKYDNNEKDCSNQHSTKQVRYRNILYIGKMIIIFNFVILLKVTNVLLT